MKKINLLIMVMLFLISPLSQAKVALLIGNDAYSGKPFSSLEKAISDATRLANKLKGLGFTVIQKNDLNAKEMRDAIREFHDALTKNNDVGVFYYAGHGMQIEGNNFLIPLDTHINREFEVEAEAINADLILNAMFGAKTKINLIILDACRDNGFSTRGGKRGLAAISRENTFVAYSTQPNKTAEDGTFMDYLSQRITEPLPIDQMFKKVIDDVRKETGGSQVPSFNYNLVHDFYFNDTNKAVIIPEIAFANQILGDVLVRKGGESSAPKKKDKWKAIEHYQVKDGLAKDIKTELMWMRCGIGQTWKNENCEGQPTFFNWEKANSTSKKIKYAGYDDWRIPTKEELKALVYCSNSLIRTYKYAGRTSCKEDYSSPTINVATFPNTGYKRQYWANKRFTETHLKRGKEDTQDYTWVINFDNGNDVAVSLHDSDYYLRLVRDIK